MGIATFTQDFREHDILNGLFINNITSVIFLLLSKQNKHVKETNLLEFRRNK